MRPSSDTDRTFVPTRRNSEEHLDPLEEKNTNMSEPYRQTSQLAGEQLERETPDSSGYNSSDEKDLEGGHDPDQDNKDEEIRQQKKEQEGDPNLVEWDGPDDPENPLNWKVSKKWIITVSLGFMTFCVTFASSAFSNATVPVAREFGVSTEVTTLGTSLFVLGFAFGPLLWGPASEVFGRKRPLFIGYAIFAIFQIPVAVAQNLETIMLMRFFGGVFASAPLAIVGGSFVDFWGPVDRGVAVCVFASATFIGPVAGPIMGYVHSLPLSRTIANIDAVASLPSHIWDGDGPPG